MRTSRTAPTHYGLNWVKSVTLAITCFVVPVLLLPALTGQQASTQTSGSATRVHRSQVAVHYRELFRSLGNRLEVPGKERLVVMASLTQPARSAAGTRVVVTTDIAGMLRLDGQIGLNAVAVVFDGKQAQNSAGQAGKADQDLVDSLTEDTVEHFLTALANGGGVRKLALRAKVSDPQHPSVPVVYCDVYQIVDRSQASWKSAPQVKSYCFDSQTHLLRGVSYRPPGGSTLVETRYTDWRPVDATGQMASWKVERFENGTQVLAFTVQSAAVAAAASDDKFKAMPTK